MNQIYIPTTTPDDWRRLLADPDRQWRTGYSARTLAHAWEDSDGFPPEIEQLFSTSSVPEVKVPILQLAIPEHKVSLPPRNGHPSQNDLFVIAWVPDGLIAISVEGKVSEPFGPTMEEWRREMTDGKTKRLKFLKDALQLTSEIPSTIRYQLLHRTVSAILEAKRFHCRYAAMLVHAFGDQSDSIADYKAFLQLFGVNNGESLVQLAVIDGVKLFSGGAQGDDKYLRC